jgi:sodium pump decarboxylase gamma subunit
MDELLQKILEGGGLTLTWLGMGTVFFCLLVLYLFFAGTGLMVKRGGGRKEPEQAKPSGYNEIEAEDNESQEISGELSAAIAMALNSALAGTGPRLSSFPESEVGTWRITGRLAQHARSRFWER